MKYKKSYWLDPEYEFSDQPFNAERKDKQFYIGICKTVRCKWNIRY